MKLMPEKLRQFDWVFWSIAGCVAFSLFLGVVSVYEADKYIDRIAALEQRNAQKVSELQVVTSRLNAQDAKLRAVNNRQNQLIRELQKRYPGLKIRTLSLGAKAPSGARVPGNGSKGNGKPGSGHPSKPNNPSKPPKQPANPPANPPASPPPPPAPIPPDNDVCVTSVCLDIPIL